MLFSENIVMRCYSMPEIRDLPLEKQSNIVHGIEKILDEEETNAAISNNAELRRLSAVPVL